MKICVINMYKDVMPIDFVSLFHKIDKNIRLVVYKVLHPDLLNVVRMYDAIIISGSERRILDKKNNDGLPKDLLSIGIPVLGICYGFQWMVHSSGGIVSTFANDIEHSYNKYLTIQKPFNVSRHKYRFYHHDYIAKLSQSFIKTLGNGNEIWIAYDNDRKHLGIQFHPEHCFSTSNDFFRNWIRWIK